jgi:hypothetical protein
MWKKDLRIFLKPSFGDFLIIILIIATIFLYSAKMKGIDNSLVIVEINGKIKYTFHTTVDTTISSDGYRGPFSFEIKDKKVKMKNSTCPLHTCVKQGWIKNNNEMIICMPNRIKISFSRSDYDAVTK